MVSFRRCILALAVLSLLVGVASAQIGAGNTNAGPNLQCTVQTTTPLVRAEGATEQLGDIQIFCTGGTTPVLGAPVPTATFTITLNVPVTSRLLSTGSTSQLGNASEALLLIDEPNTPTTGANPGPGPFLPLNLVPATTTSATANFVVGQGTAGAFAFTEACGNTTCTAPVAGVTTGVPNLFQGTVANTFQLVFANVPVLAPGTTGTRSFRITNIRGDANFQGTPAISTQTTINASLSFTSTNGAPISVPTPLVPIGFAQTGLGASVRTTTNGSTSSTPPTSLSFLQCANPSGAISATTPVGGAILRFTAAFGTAFKTRVAATTTTNGLLSTVAQNVPGISFSSGESGFIVPTLTSSTGATAGLADFGTRLRAVFSNIPTGVNVFVTTSNILTNGGGSASITNGATVSVNNSSFTTSFTTSSITNSTATNPIAILVLSETAPDFGTLVPAAVATTSSTAAGNLPVFQIPLSNGAGEANWEVVQFPAGATNLDFGVFFQFTPVAATSTTAASPAAGTGTVAMSFSPVPSSPTGGTTFPVSALATATSGPIPRFADTSAAHLFNIVTINLCQTTLLFPYVTNTAGFETGLAIANTSADTFGTTPQTGTCTLTFFGNNIVAGKPASFTVPPFVTAAVPAGGVFADILSHITTVPPNESAPGGGNNLTGYMFATCNFQYAHGFAFISDASATGLAEGYLALVVSGPGTVATRGTALVFPSAAETLFH